MDFKIREDRGQSQGRRPLIREREEYFRLMDLGYTDKEASRLVGGGWDGRVVFAGTKEGCWCRCPGWSPGASG